MNMPERIWAEVIEDRKYPTMPDRSWEPEAVGGTEYIRADLVAEKDAENAALNRERQAAVAANIELKAEIERRRGGVVAEIQRLKHLNDNAVARIEFLEKVAEQLVQFSGVRLPSDVESEVFFDVGAIVMDGDGMLRVGVGFEAAAYLREPDNRTPERVVQNVVQNGEEEGKTDV